MIHWVVELVVVVVKLLCDSCSWKKTQRTLPKRGIRVRNTYAAMYYEFHYHYGYNQWDEIVYRIFNIIEDHSFLYK